MSRLFTRVLALTLIKPVTDSSGPRGFFAQQPNAVTIRSMRVKFHIEKALGKSPNKASVTITNLAETTRAQIEKAPLIVRLEVGYDGQENLQTLFTGDLRTAFTSHDGPDVNTTLQMGEGDRAFQFAHVNRSFAPNSTILDAVKECAKTIGLDLPKAILNAPELARQHANGVSLHGPAQKVLTSLLLPVGYSWSMQEGKLIALKQAQVLENQAVVIQQQDGMIGSPQLAPPKKPGESAMLTVKTLVDPRIVAGCKIDVRSKDKVVNGLFRVEKCTHTGDSRSKDWYTSIEARLL